MFLNTIVKFGVTRGIQAQSHRRAVKCNQFIDSTNTCVDERPRLAANPTHQRFQQEEHISPSQTRVFLPANCGRSSFRDSPNSSDRPFGSWCGQLAQRSEGQKLRTRCCNGVFGNTSLKALCFFQFSKKFFRNLGQSSPWRVERQRAPVGHIQPFWKSSSPSPHLPPS